MSRKAEWPRRFLEPFSGTLVVDGYSGYNTVLERPHVIEAGCMGYARPPFQEIAQATPIAQSALIVIGKALAYAINRWSALIRYLDDGMLNLDNNPVENAIRGISRGRRNWLCAGFDAGGRRATQFDTLIETAKLNGVNPNACPKHVLTTLPSAKVKDLDALLPWIINPSLSPKS